MEKRPLRLTRLILRNWRNFKDVDVRLGRRVFLVGPNASGKSNLLDALRFLHALVRPINHGLQTAVSDRNGISRLRWYGARQNPKIEIGVILGTDEQPEEWKYSLSLGQDSNKRPVVEGEKVECRGSTVRSRPDEKDRADPARKSQTHLEQINENQGFREMAEFLAQIQYLHIVPQLVKEPERSSDRHGRNDPYGSDFLAQMWMTPKKTRDTRLARIRDALHFAVPQLEELTMEGPDVHGRPHLKGNYRHWRPQGAWQNETDFSDGTLRLIGLLWSMFSGEGPLLLEEPELSLHPDVVRHIPQMFARLQRRRGRQVLLSTHSPDLLVDEGIGLDEVLLLTPTAEGTEVRLASDIAEIRALLEGGVPLAEAVRPHTAPPAADQLVLRLGL